MPDTSDGYADAGAAGQKALKIAYSYLNRRERTEAEMRAHLEGKGVEPRELEWAVAELAEEGHLDDGRFARLFVQDKRELEEWGSERIEQALLARGVDREVIGEALAEEDSGNEVERALALLRRRFPSPVDDRREHERALGVLLRKGYDVEVALDAIAVHARGT